MVSPLNRAVHVMNFTEGVLLFSCLWYQRLLARSSKSSSVNKFALTSCLYCLRVGIAAIGQQRTNESEPA